MAVIADDFSGCTDAELQLFRFSVRTVSLLPHAALERFLEDHDVVVVDNEARVSDAATAYAVTRALAGRLAHEGIRRLFKKVDSTFRGNIGAELDGAMDALGGDRCVLVPAYPANGRTTRHGQHRVHGRLISETEFATDPNYPIGESDLASLLRAQTRRAVGNLVLEDIRCGAAALAGTMDMAWRSGQSILIADAETDLDMQTIAQAAERTRHCDLTAGSAAMLGALALSMGLAGRPPVTPVPIPSPVLVVCGSVHPNSARQIETLRTSRPSHLAAIDVPRLLDPHERPAEIRRAVQEAIQGLRSGTTTIMTTHIRRAQGADPREVSRILLNDLEAVVRQVCETCPVRNFYVIGGHTCLAVCRALGMDGVSVAGAIEPGIALCSSVGGPEQRRLVIKPGGFGSPDAVLAGVCRLSSSPDARLGDP
jgi:uncharacterized protein YgbK (DUF1537 family)